MFAIARHVHHVHQSQQAEAELAQQAHEASMRRRRAQGGGSTLIQKPGTPEPVDGRRHMDIQTEDYLEELSDKVLWCFFSPAFCAFVLPCVSCFLILWRGPVYRLLSRSYSSVPHASPFQSFLCVTG